MQVRTWDLPDQADGQRATELDSLSFGRDGLTLDLRENEPGRRKKTRMHVPGPALRALLLRRGNGSRHHQQAVGIHKDFMVALSSLVGSVVLARVLKNGDTIRVVRARSLALEQA